MRVPKSFSAACWIAVGVGLCLVAGVRADDAGVAPPTAAQLLAGVAHISDDDVRFRTAGGVVVFVDPVNGPTDPQVVTAGLVKPDLILITHPHGDHFQPAVIKEYLKLNPQAKLAGPADVVGRARENGIDGATAVVPGQDYTVAGIRFSTVPAWSNSHAKDRQWVGYVLQLDKARYYVTGDTDPQPEMAKTNADVIFPILQGCGGNLDQALEMAESSKARVAVPVHTGGRQEAIDKFIAQLPKPIQGAYYKDGKFVIPS